MRSGCAAALQLLSLLHKFYSSPSNGELLGTSPDSWWKSDLSEFAKKVATRILYALFKKEKKSRRPQCPAMCVQFTNPETSSSLERGVIVVPY